MLDRRSFLAATASGLGAAMAAAPPAQLTASLRHAAHAAGGGQQPAMEVLTAEQAADLDAITAQIIPTDELPGAREAGVVHFIDHSLATWGQAQREPTLAGLAEFNGLVAQRHPGRRFSQLTGDEQIAFLRANEQHGFFQQIRATTLIGTFSNPSWGGNRDGAGYRIVGFEPRFFWEPPFGEYDAGAHGAGR